MGAGSEPVLISNVPIYLVFFLGFTLPGPLVSVLSSPLLSLFSFKSRQSHTPALRYGFYLSHGDITKKHRANSAWPSLPLGWAFADWAQMLV